MNIPSPDQCLELIEKMEMMSHIIVHTESDPSYRMAIDSSRSEPLAVAADAIGSAMRDITALLDAAVIVAYTSSGYSALKMARERPSAPVIGMTPRLSTARRLALAWGVHAMLCREVNDVEEMTELASRTALEQGFGDAGRTIVISAGMPFGAYGTTNLLHIAQI